MCTFSHTRIRILFCVIIIKNNLLFVTFFPQGDPGIEGPIGHPGPKVSLSSVGNEIFKVETFI